MQAEQLARELEERRRALLDAAQAAPVDGSTQRERNAGARRCDAAGASSLPSPVLPADLLGIASQPRASENQDERDAFLTSAASASRDRLFAARQDDPSPYELHAGSVIPAVLLTGINADLPGTIVAQVRNDVFDSVTGRYLLIPRGTRLVGTYDNRIVQGQRRVLVAWTRLLYPDGSSLDLLGMPGTDEAGYAGFGANVDEHLNKVFTSALLLSIIGAGAQLSQPQQSSSLYAAPSIGQTIAGAFGQQIGNTSIQLTQRQLEIPPTLEVPPGYLFNVLVDRDIVLTAPYGEAGARCPPTRAAELGQQRGYIATGPCADDTELLLKSVAAIAGDNVDLSIQRNGQRLPATLQPRGSERPLSAHAKAMAATAL